MGRLKRAIRITRTTAGATSPELARRPAEQRLFEWCISYAARTKREEMRLRDMPDGLFAMLAPAADGELSDLATQVVVVLYLYSHPTSVSTVRVEVDELRSASEAFLANLCLEAERRAGHIHFEIVGSIFRLDSEVVFSGAVNDRQAGFDR